MDFREERVQTSPRLGDAAPRFEALSTRGKIRLEDFKGRWLVFFSHPSDFTPVCTSEFIAFAEIHPRLRELDCELLGLSIDSVYSHIAWVREIEKNMGLRIEYPVIADQNREVATLYGMVMPGESMVETVRSVFVIDNAQRIRAMISYPLSIGRNTVEIVRLVQALQTADRHEAAIPANWHPGDRVFVPPPATQEQAEERTRDQSVECLDWYFCKRDL